MANTNITIREEGFDELGKIMKKLVKFIKKPRKAFAGASIVMFKDVQDHFMKSQGPKGKWLPLKHRKGQPLRKSGMLMNSFSKFSDDKQAVVGTILKEKYAATHNFGRGRIPARPFMWLSKKKDDTIRKIFINEMDSLFPSF